MRKAGDSNYYQFKIISLIGIQWIVTAFVIMIQPFLNAMPVFLCPDGNNEGQYITCNEVDATNQGCMIDKSASPQSLVIDLGLYCDKADLRTLAQTLFFAGGSLGFIVFAAYADKKGRKPALALSYMFGCLAFLILGLWHTSIIAYMVLLSFTWAGYDPYFAFSLIMLNENSGPKIRQISSPILMVFWGVGEMIFVLIAYLIQDWQDELLFGVAIPGAICFVFFVFIHESPR